MSDDVIPFPKETLDKAKELVEGVEVDLDKPLEEDYKYEIIYDETGCTEWGFEVNDQWRGANRLEGVKSLEEDDELIDYVLAKLKKGIKDGEIDFKDVMECFQEDDHYSPDESCETCGHWGHKTIWKI